MNPANSGRTYSHEASGRAAGRRDADLRVDVEDGSVVSTWRPSDEVDLLIHLIVGIDRTPDRLLRRNRLSIPELACWLSTSRREAGLTPPPPEKE